MRIKVGDTVIIKKREYLSEEYPRWVRDAVRSKEELTVIKAISMKGFLVKAPEGHTRLFNGCDLRVI